MLISLLNNNNKYDFLIFKDAVRPFKSALVADGVPATSFQVDNLDAEYERLTGLGVAFSQSPMDAGSVRIAVLDDTCGNLIQLVQQKAGLE